MRALQEARSPSARCAETEQLRFPLPILDKRREGDDRLASQATAKGLPELLSNVCGTRH